jgi:hypothetical protein
MKHFKHLIVLDQYLDKAFQKRQKSPFQLFSSSEGFFLGNLHCNHYLRHIIQIQIERKSFE